MGAISKGWHPTSCNIVHSRVEIDSGDTTAQSGDTVSSAGYLYKADVVYEYAANAVKYSARKVFFAETSSKNLKAVQAVVLRYPAGSIKNVYYDPLKPSRAVLEPGIQLINIPALVIGGLFVLIGAAMCLSGIFGFEQFFDVIGSEFLFRATTTLGPIAGLALLVIGFSSRAY